MRIVILGLSMTSSWGNGHATTYRGLVRELSQRGHDVLFLERDQPWYSANRDLPNPPFGQTKLYRGIAELRSRYGEQISSADCVVVGSYVPEGIAVGNWVTAHAQGVTAFYDIDTPVTLGKLKTGECEYLSPALAGRYSMYLSFSGGPILEEIRGRYNAPFVHPLYCSVDPALYFHETRPKKWELGYLGTYSEDRQAALERMLIEPACRNSSLGMVVAGAQYPDTIRWPSKVDRFNHVDPADHRAFYNSQRFTLNITRAEMFRAGHSPSVRLFEAAACATPIITDEWRGLEEFFVPGREILVANTTRDVLEILHDLPENEAREIGRRGRDRVIESHTAAHRAAELESLIMSRFISHRDPAPARASMI